MQSSQPKDPKDRGQVLRGEEMLRVDEFLSVTAKREHNSIRFDIPLKLIYQSDGNLVLYAYGTQRVVLWDSKTWGKSNPDVAKMQADGNFSLYSGGTAYWDTKTRGLNSRIELQADGNLVIYDGLNKVLWEAGTKNVLDTKVSELAPTTISVKGVTETASCSVSLGSNPLRSNQKQSIVNFQNITTNGSNMSIITMTKTNFTCAIQAGEVYSFTTVAAGATAQTFTVFYKEDFQGVWRLYTMARLTMVPGVEYTFSRVDAGSGSSEPPYVGVVGGASMDSILNSLTGSVSPALQPIAELTRPREILMSSARWTFMCSMRWSHLKAMSSTERNVDVFFSPSVPKTTNVVLRLDQIASAVYTWDQFRAVEPTTPNELLIPAIRSMTEKICVRAALDHLSCRLGKQQSAGVCSSSFDTETRSAALQHMRYILDTIDRNVRTNPRDVQNMDQWLGRCRNETIAYVRFAADSARSRGNTPTSLMPASQAAMYSLLANTIPPSYTLAIFANPALASDIIFNCLQPILRFRYVNLYSSSDRFSDQWVAQYVIYLFGYFVADDVASALRASPMPEQNVTDTFVNMKKCITTHLMLLTRVQPDLLDLYQRTVGAMQDNMASSASLEESNAVLETRRRSMQIMGHYYLSNKKQAAAVRGWMIAVIVVYAVLTLVITGLIVDGSMAGAAILLSGIVMVGIIIYSLTTSIRTYVK